MKPDDYRRRDLEVVATTSGYGVRVLGRERLLVRVVRDVKYPGMWRIKEGVFGVLSDMVNLTRAKDAALDRALGVLRRQDTPAGTGGIGYSDLNTPAATTLPAASKTAPVTFTPGAGV
jgi:hypothetical protein